MARVRQLDSIRGIAAFAVALTHSLQPFSAASKSSQDVGSATLAVARSLLDSSVAVGFFFVLSGYVLTIALEKRPNWRDYTAKRFFRLMPPLLAAIVFGFVVSNALMTLALPGSFDAVRPYDPVTLGNVIENALLWRPSALGVSWTIIAEALGSAVVLIMVLFPRAAIPMLLLTLILPTLPYPLDWWAHISHLYGFAFGSLIAKRSQFKSSPWAFFGTGVGLIFIELMWPSGSWVRDLVCTIGVAALLIGVLQTAPQCLLWAPLQWLGEVSFSFYLIHPTVLAAVFALSALLGIDGVGGSYFLLIVSVTLALPAVALARRWIELPSIALGARLLRGKPEIPAALP